MTDLSATTYFEEAFSRNIGILTKDEQERLASARVAIPGLGGVGGAHLVALTRVGIGKFHIADFDVFEPVNINRQYGARSSTFGQAKLDVLFHEAKDINPFLEIETFPEGLSPENLDIFLRGVDVVVDGLDFFAFDIRRMLFKRAKALGIPVITAGPLGFGTALLVFDPEKSPDFDDYFAIRPEMDEVEKIIAFAMGLAPKGLHLSYIDPESVDISAQKGPSLSAACFLCASMATVEVLRIILGRPGGVRVPEYVQFDPYKMRFVKSCLRWGNKGPIQRFKIWIAKRRYASEK